MCLHCHPLLLKTKRTQKNKGSEVRDAFFPPLSSSCSVLPPLVILSYKIHIQYSKQNTHIDNTYLTEISPVSLPVICIICILSQFFINGYTCRFMHLLHDSDTAAFPLQQRSITTWAACVPHYNHTLLPPLPPVPHQQPLNLCAMSILSMSVGDSSGLLSVRPP